MVPTLLQHSKRETREEANQRIGDKQIIRFCSFLPTKKFSQISGNSLRTCTVGFLL